MISGRLTEDRLPLVTLNLIDHNEVVHPVTFLVDTWYDGWLVLPPDIVRELALPPTGDANIVTVAGGASLEWANYRARLYWNGRIRDVVVLESDTMPLLGMAMLDDPAGGCADLLVINSADRSVSIRHQPPPYGAEN